MTYLKMCDVDAVEDRFREAVRGLGQALRSFAAKTGHWEVADKPPSVFYQGVCKVHMEYNTVYWAIDNPAIEAFLAQIPEMKSRFRRPGTVSVIAQL